MTLNNKRILITGAGGFIGSHLCEYLCDRFCDVRAFLHYNSRNDLGLLNFLPKMKLGQLEIFPGDLRDPDTVRKSMQGIDIIFHLGALISIPYSYLYPREVIETNVLGTLNILMATKEKGIRKIVNVSTSEVYGSALYVPVDEKHPLQAQSPYSASKIAAEKLCESFYRTYALPVATVRFFNCFGPRQSARAVIPTIVTQALVSNKIKIGAVTPKRDFTYVADLVRGLVAVAESDATVGEVINLGSGFSISIKEMIDEVSHLLHKKLIIVSEEKRKRPNKSEVTELLADYTKAKEVLGWKPEVSFQDGLKKTIAWINKNLSIYTPQKYNI